MSQQKYPQIRINFSWLLYYDVCEKIANAEGWELPSFEDCENWTESYRKAWDKHEAKALRAMQNILGLEFCNSTYDISTAPGIIAKSDPLIINFKDHPEQTVSVIIHEMVHVLLTDNTIISLKGNGRNFLLADEWQKLFGFKDDFDALVHVPVHAVHRKIYEEILNQPELVLADRDEMTKNNANSYIKSWEYVKKQGADNIIEKLKISYAEIEKKLEKQK